MSDKYKLPEDIAKAIDTRAVHYVGVMKHLMWNHGLEKEEAQHLMLLMALWGIGE